MALLILAAPGPSASTLPKNGTSTFLCIARHGTDHQPAAPIAALNAAFVTLRTCTQATEALLEGLTRF